MESGFFLASAIGSLSPDLVLVTGVGLIFATFAMAFAQALRKRGTRFVENAPTLMTSMGIIGTFLGIVIGLIGFDVEQIDASIPVLLEGLKTAFLTSVAGMIGAVVFKWLDACWLAGRREPEGAAEDVSPGQILKALDDSNEHLISVRDALAKDSDSSLVGVVQRMRSDLSDRATDDRRDREAFQTKLFGEMQNFADLLSKSATEAVIEALKVVIQDFNKNLTEQFGDNFKRLDESVKKLVTWQQQYMVQLEAMSTQYGEGVKAIDATRVSVESISERTAEIPTHMSALQDVVMTNQHQIQELQRHLEAFVTMREKATDAIPAIDKHLNEVGENLKGAANDMRIVMLEGAANFKESVTQTNTAMQDLASGMQGHSEQVADTLKETAVGFESSSRKSMEEVETRISETISSIGNQLERSTNELHREMTKHLGQVEENLTSAASEVKNAIQTGANDFSDSVKQTNESVTSLATTVQGHSEQVAESLKTSGQNLETTWAKALNELESGISNTTASIKTALERTTEELNREISKSINKSLSMSEQQIEGATTKTNESINKQLQALDDAMGKELTRVMEEMGSALAKISGQFAQDYRGLVSAMNDIVSQRAA